MRWRCHLLADMLYCWRCGCGYRMSLLRLLSNSLVLTHPTGTLMGITTGRFYVMHEQLSMRSYVVMCGFTTWV